MIRTRQNDFTDYQLHVEFVDAVRSCKAHTVRDVATAACS